MEFKIGNKVKIIQRKPGNTTGAENCGKPNGDVGSIGFITSIHDTDFTYCIENDRKYYGFFDKDDLELLIDKQEDLTGRWLKALKDKPESTDYEKNDYIKIKSGNFNDAYCDDEYTFWVTPSKKDLYELMPEGFDPDQSIPKYVKCTTSFINHTKGTIYYVFPDGYVQNDLKDKSNLTYDGGGFKPTTEEAYDAQFITMDKNKFKKGDYVVLLASCDGGNCWESSLPINYCYRLRDNSNSHNFNVMLDVTDSSTNGWGANDSYDSKLNIRAATIKEIGEYDRLGRPYNVTVLTKTDMEAIQEECKKRYPIGSEIQSVGNDYTHCLKKDGGLYSIHGKTIYSTSGNGLLYDDGKWAKLVSLPFEETKSQYIEINDSYVGKYVSLNYGSLFYDKVLVTKEQDEIYLLNNCYSNNDGHSNNRSKFQYSLMFSSFYLLNSNCKNIQLLDIPKTTEPYEYTAKEALAELKRRGFKEGVEYTYMYPDGKYDESDINTADYDPKIHSSGTYIDCAAGYLWHIEYPSNLHRGPIVEITKTEPVPEFNGSKFYNWDTPTVQTGTYYESRTPDYSRPETLLPKTTLNY